MSQRRRSDVSYDAPGRRRQQTSSLPGDISKKAIVQGLLGRKTFAQTEMLAADFQTPHTFATLLDDWETGVAGLAPAASTYVFDLSTIGFTVSAKVSAKFAPNTVIYVLLDKGGNTYIMKVDASDVFTATAVPGGAITINAGACSINRATGALTLVTQADTDDLSGANWVMQAFVIEGGRDVTGAAPHGGGWGLATYSPRSGFVEIPHVNAAGAALSAAEARIYLQSLPEPGGGNFANTNFQAAFLISPFIQMKDDTTLYYHTGADPKAVLDPADVGWTAFAWDDISDLAGDTLLYTTKTIGGIGAAVKIVTLRIDMNPATVTESTFVYGFGIGIN